MKDEEKTKEQLVKELAAMRQRLVDLEASEAQRKRAEEALRRADAETQRRLQEQIALREVGTVISSTLDVETVLSRLAQQMGRAVDATSAYILWREPEAKAFTAVAEYIGPQACAAERASDLGVTYPCTEEDMEFVEAMEAGRHDISQLDDPDLSESERAHMQQYGAQTILYIPLRIRDQLIGHAELWESRRQREFTPEEIVLCQGIAQQAAIAIENARLYQEAQREVAERKRAEEMVRRHLERAEALREIDRAVTSTLDLSGVLDIILGELKRVIPYHSAGIFLLSDGTAKLAAGKGFPDLERALQVAFRVEEDALARELLREKRPLVLADAQADERFRARGGTTYVRSWIGVPLMVKGRAAGFLTIDHRKAGVYDEQSAEIAQRFASQAAIAIENARLYEETQRELAERERAEEELQQSFETLRRAFEGTVTVLVSAVEMRDPYTAGHQRRVTQLACAIANEMDLPQEQIEGIRLAGLIHDIGKINVPAEILSKPGQLTDLEFGLIKMHPQTGHDVLRAIEFPWPVAQIVLQHHERMDGSGYPQGLSGEEIILEAKILGVADVVEAMASHRPYRAARGIDEALEEISQNRDTLYDPKVVDACLRLFTEKGFKFE